MIDTRSPETSEPTGDEASAPALELAIRGQLREMSAAQRRLLLERETIEDREVAERTAEILESVREGGDRALQRLARDLDGVDLDLLEVSRSAWDDAVEALRDEVVDALERAAAAIDRVHRSRLPEPGRVDVAPGLVVGRRAVPLARVGAYAPGGRAAYPSSVLMCAVPARVAGVGELIVCSPPGPDGLPAAAVRAACAVADVDRLFALGGAGAIAAMTWGTESVPRVDKIVGPGNVWVEEAKLQVSRRVAIDCPAGPSELLVIADETADADRVAAELIAQAEHDPRAAVALVSTSTEMLQRVETSLGEQLSGLATGDTVRRALGSRGALLLASSLEQALEAAEAYAPEHLLLACRRSEELAGSIRNAGTVLFGAGASVTFGDYATGANHVLPTGGRARIYSGLGVEEFVRWVGWQRIEDRAAPALAGTTTVLAGVEGLEGHAAAARRAADAADVDGRETVVEPRHGPDLAIPGGIRRARRYDPGRREAEVELSDNTNLFGTSPAALEVLRTSPDRGLRRYPTVYGDGLKDALAERLDVPRECIATGCGSDDLLDASFRAFAGPGGTIAFPDPTFSMVRAFGGINDARLVPVECGPDLRADTAALAAAEAAVVYLCRPDNPSGLLVPEEELEPLLSRDSRTLVVDEAYGQFAEAPSLMPRAATTPGLVVLRTFSKAWGLAGLRIGYAVASPEWIDLLERARGPYKLNALAEAAASAALREDRAWVRETVEQARDARDRLRRRLEQRRLEIFPSAANFLLFRVDDAVGVAAALRERGVGVRPFPGLPPGDCIRVTVAPEEMMERFLEALDEVLDDSDGRD